MLTGVRVCCEPHAGVVMLWCRCCALVILNGGEAAVRDRTMAGRFDVVHGNAHAACSIYGPGYCIAALCVSYGPSEGYRPPQDDITVDSRITFGWVALRPVETGGAGTIRSSGLSTSDYSFR